MVVAWHWEFQWIQPQIFVEILQKHPKFFAPILLSLMAARGSLNAVAAAGEVAAVEEQES